MLRRFIIAKYQEDQKHADKKTAVLGGAPRSRRTAFQRPRPRLSLLVGLPGGATGISGQFERARPQPRSADDRFFHRRQSSRLRHRIAGFPLDETGPTAGRRGLWVRSRGRRSFGRAPGGGQAETGMLLPGISGVEPAARLAFRSRSGRQYRRALRAQKSLGARAARRRRAAAAHQPRAGRSHRSRSRALLVRRDLRPDRRRPGARRKSAHADFTRVGPTRDFAQSRPSGRAQHPLFQRTAHRFSRQRREVPGNFQSLRPARDLLGPRSQSDSLARARHRHRLRLRSLRQPHSDRHTGAAPDDLRQREPRRAGSLREDSIQFMISTVAALAAVFLWTAGFLPAARAEEKVRLSVAAVTASYMDEFVAIEKGFHREEGLAVEMIRAGGGVATQALIAGDLQF